MRIGVVGFGYVGFAVANAFGNLGNAIYVNDTSDAALEKAKAKGYVPCYKLENLVDNSDIIFICVPTPSNSDGSNDSKAVYEVVMRIADVSKRQKIVVIKSTVMVGTTRRLIRTARTRNKKLHLLSNPEFLTAMNANKDFLNPDRIVIGGRDRKAIKALCDLYKTFSKHIVVVDSDTAELAKYASNAFLTTKVSFANQMGLVCRRMRVDPLEVMKIVGLDRRIGPSHLNPNKGPFEGSCLPKDLDALLFETDRIGVDNVLLKEVRNINERIKDGRDAKS